MEISTNAARLVFRLYCPEPGRLWLRCYVWNEETHGFEASDRPVELTREDRAELLAILDG